MARVKGTCSRPGCDRVMDRRKLCGPHYNFAYPLQGYTETGVAREHVRQLRSRGMTLDMLEDQGVTRSVVARINNGRQKIHRMTEATILAITIPQAVVPSEAEVSSLGTIRRIQALAVIGWTQTVLAERLGWTQSRLANHLAREKVNANTAAAVAGLFNELQLIPGPSRIARERAVLKGWASPMAYDEIDDPTEIPKTGALVDVTAAERIDELRELGITDIRAIAFRLGIQPDSVHRAIGRSAA